jgi:hypothetical protein
MPRTSFGKTKTQDRPYAIYKNTNGWEWRVLKTYKHKENENDYSRWFVAATSPMMHEEGRFEMGDTYARDVLQYGYLVEATPEWEALYGAHDDEAAMFLRHQSLGLNQ